MNHTSRLTTLKIRVCRQDGFSCFTMHVLLYSRRTCATYTNTYSRKNHSENKNLEKHTKKHKTHEKIFVFNGSIFNVNDTQKSICSKSCASS